MTNLMMLGILRLILPQHQPPVRPELSSNLGKDSVLLTSAIGDRLYLIKIQ
ncbi:MAG: hypothetical protein ACK58N_20685 [Synechocystis sp.]|jgi:hypothetical protein